MRLPSLHQSFPKIASKLKLYVFLFILAGAIVTGLFYLSDFFSIKSIEVVSELPADKIIGINTLKNKNIFFLSVKESEEALLSQNPGVAHISIQKHYPNSLIILIRPTAPLAYLRLNGGYALLDDNSKIVAKTKTPEKPLPLINFYQLFDFAQMRIGETLIYKEMVAAIYLLKSAQDLNLRVESIDINGLSMIVFNVKNPARGGESHPTDMPVTILFSGEKNKDKQAFELETIIKRFKIEAKEFKTLDFRFDKPVVTF